MTNSFERACTYSYRAEELRAIAAALTRIANGTYGTCANCGLPISKERLAAVPYAPLCEECMPHS